MNEADLRRWHQTGSPNKGTDERADEVIASLDRASRAGVWAWIEGKDLADNRSMGTYAQAWEAAWKSAKMAKLPRTERRSPLQRQIMQEADDIERYDRAAARRLREVAGRELEEASPLSQERLEALVKHLRGEEIALEDLALLKRARLVGKGV